ncbi:hypothetical protein BCR42DRAFT_409643 [Absidia repens]|uniref:Uncharacterized protein n=1 Tax=Absidia repens TaxID=90262 RepID=A0A1X2IMW5_9FUNG|nr:hypothetical protein BCR42DRAFT_409643 [Absidia repens]
MVAYPCLVYSWILVKETTLLLYIYIYILSYHWERYLHQDTMIRKFSSRVCIHSMTPCKTQNTLSTWSSLSYDLHALLTKQGVAYFHPLVHYKGCLD